MSAGTRKRSPSGPPHHVLAYTSPRSTEVDAPSSPDPVSEPKAYQDHLLGLLGDDDPAEVQASGGAAWRAIVGEAAELGLVRPAPSEWSVVECLGHAVDAEVGRASCRERVWIPV